MLPAWFFIIPGLIALTIVAIIPASKWLTRKDRQENGH